MAVQKKSVEEFTVEELDKELIARGAQIPNEKRFEFLDREGTPERFAIMKQAKELYNTAPSPDKNLSHINTWELTELLIQKIQESNDIRGIWYTDYRMDYYEIQDEQVRRNADCVAAICFKDDLIDIQNNFSSLRVKNYGNTFNLCDCEQFYHQPIAAGPLCTGFLIEEDLIATAAHFVNENNVTNLKIIFGFVMLDAHTPVTLIPVEDIYNGSKMIRRVYNPRGNRSDWAMLQLDRKVKNHAISSLSTKNISLDVPLYVIGHPCGLPLKYAPDAKVSNIYGSYFGACLDVYSGNSGSPVFDNNTHEVVGMVVRGDNKDFRWTGKGWLSVIYPSNDIHSEGAECTCVSEFINNVKPLHQQRKKRPSENRGSKSLD